jgi:hypothetical protein
MSADDDFCPICGEKVGKDQLAAMTHQCREEVLRRIDAAHRRGPSAPTAHEWPSEARRLYDGLRWCEQDDEADGERSS